jgi:hypothetical protein
MNIVLGLAVYVAMSFAISALTGCAAPKPGTPEARAVAVEKEEKKKEEQVTHTLSITPDWFLDLPQSDNAIYASGTGVSPSLQLSMDKGVLNAKRTLADRLQGLLSSRSKLFVVEQGQGEATVATTESEQVTSNLIAEVNVGGYTVKESETFSEGPRYRSFVLLEYPVGKLNRVQIDTLRKQQNAASEDKAKDAHRKLEEAIEEKRL